MGKSKPPTTPAEQQSAIPNVHTADTDKIRSIDDADQVNPITSDTAERVETATGPITGEVFPIDPEDIDDLREHADADEEDIQDDGEPNVTLTGVNFYPDDRTPQPETPDWHDHRPAEDLEPEVATEGDVITSPMLVIGEPFDITRNFRTIRQEVSRLSDNLTNSITKLQEHDQELRKMQSENRATREAVVELTESKKLQLDKLQEIASTLASRKAEKEAHEIPIQRVLRGFKGKYSWLKLNTQNGPTLEITFNNETFNLEYQPASGEIILYPTSTNESAATTSIFSLQNTISQNLGLGFEFEEKVINHNGTEIRGLSWLVGPNLKTRFNDLEADIDAENDLSIQDLDSLIYDIMRLEKEQKEENDGMKEIIRKLAAASRKVSTQNAEIDKLYNTTMHTLKTNILKIKLKLPDLHELSELAEKYPLARLIPELDNLDITILTNGHNGITVSIVNPENTKELSLVYRPDCQVLELVTKSAHDTEFSTKLKSVVTEAMRKRFPMKTFHQVDKGISWNVTEADLREFNS